MQTIWKFLVTAKTVIELPKDAQPLTVQVQHDKPQLWVLLDPKAPRIPRVFYTFGTGQDIDIPTPLRYIATWQLQERGLVFHTFEEVGEAP